LQSFFRMHQDKISSVAVVDDDGKLVGGFDPSYLKLLIKCSPEVIKESFSSIEQKLRDLPGNKNRSMDAIVTSQFTIGEILSKVSNENLHRIYIVDDEFKPSAIVSLTDLILLLIKE